MKYEDGLKETLADPGEAAAYLNAALEDGSQEVFLMPSGMLPRREGSRVSRGKPL